jgi:F0F1-type ATP synthase membrane subunit c/vacuolar-type H+-ATPase subunit K
MNTKPNKSKNRNLLKTLGVALGATGAGVGAGVLTRRLLAKVPKSAGLQRAMLMALPPAVTMGLLATQLRNSEIKKHSAPLLRLR